jgi:cytochrome c
MIKFLRATVFTLLSSLVIFGANAASPTKEDAQAIVEKAAAYATANSKDQLLAEVNKADGEFNKGELYVFVYDLNGTLIADPINKNLVGQNNVAKPDAEGKLFRKEFVETAKTKGSGWVDYKYLNPTSGKVEPKISYVKKQGDLVIIAGVYVK